MLLCVLARLMVLSCVVVLAHFNVLAHVIVLALLWYQLREDGKTKKNVSIRALP